MSILVKILVPLGLVLPLGAFVAGSLAASGSPDPGPRETIVIRDAPTGSASPHPERTPSGDPSPEDHHGTGVITPSPDDIDDHGDDSGRDGDHGAEHHGGDDHGGSGSSGSGSSGSGGSGSGGHGSDDSGHGGGDGG